MWSTRGISFWANGGWIHVTIHKQRGLEEDDEADYGNMEEKVYVSTEKTWGDNGCRSQHQLPPCELLRLQTLKLMIVILQTCAHWMVMLITSNGKS